MNKIFKPTWSKVLLTIFFVVITYFVFIYTFGCGLGSVSNLKCSVAQFFSVYVFGYALSDKIISLFAVAQERLMILFVFNIIYSYILSSVIISFLRIKKDLISLKQLTILSILILLFIFTPYVINKISSYKNKVDWGYLSQYETEEDCRISGNTWRYFNGSYGCFHYLTNSRKIQDFQDKITIERY